MFIITHSKQEMEVAIKQSRVVHALIIKQVLTMGEELKPVVYPTKIKALLEEFQGVMLEELPNGPCEISSTTLI